MNAQPLRLVFASLLLSPVLALAAAPTTIAFSARIADSGRPVTGTQGFVFKLWNDPVATDTTANLVWTEPASGTKDLAVTDGVVSAALGDTVALPAFGGAATLYLEVTMGSTTFSPRVAIQSVPYALHAQTVAVRPALVVSNTTSASVTAAATCTNIASVTITTPAAGTIYVEASATYVSWNHVAASFDYVFAYVGSAATDCTDSAGSALALTESALPAGTSYRPLATRRVFTVTGPGAYTYYFNATNSSTLASTSFFGLRTTAMYFP